MRRRFQRFAAVAGDIVNLLLERRHRVAVFLQRHELAPGAVHSFEQQQILKFLAVCEIHVDAFLDEAAELLVELFILFPVVFKHLRELGDDALRKVFADLENLRIVLKHFTGDVQREIAGINHA